MYQTDTMRELLEGVRQRRENAIRLQRRAMRLLPAIALFFCGMGFWFAGVFVDRAFLWGTWACVVVGGAVYAWAVISTRRRK